ncbi:BRD4-interacting chromatin-remodeling complex-associated protein isoform X1 [Stigmatopora argus]
MHAVLQLQKVVMDDEDGRCLLDVICDPEALNDFLHGSETHLDDLLDGSGDPTSSFFSASEGHVPEVRPTVQLSANEAAGLPRVSVDLDFLEDDDILGGSPDGEGGSNGIGTNHEPCDILQQSLAEANITEQSLQEANAELDLESFEIPGLPQVVQTLPEASLSGAAGAAVGVGISVGGTAAIFPGSAQSAAGAPPNAAADMLGSVLAHQGLQLQSQVMNKAISVQPFMQPVGLGNVTLQPISSLQTLPNGSQSGHLGIGQIQVVGQPTVMTINQSGQPILAKAMGGYQLHQSAPEVSGATTQTGLGAAGGGLLIQSNKTTLASPALNGPATVVSSANSGGGVTMTASAARLGFGGAPLSSGMAPQTQPQGQIMHNVIIQRTPTPIQPKPPQGGALQTKLFKPQQQQPQPTAANLQTEAAKALGLQQIPVSAAQNVTFLTGKPASNVVLGTQAATQGSQFQQTLFKQQAGQAAGKPLSVHLLNQSGSIVIPSQTVLQGQNHQFLLPQLQAGGQILTQHPGGHIITSQGPGGQLIANQILTANQNINLGQVLTSQGHPGAAHILSGSIQLQPGQMGTPTLFQMPVTLPQTQNQVQTHTVSGHGPTVIQGMPIQNSLTMLGQVEGLSPAVSLQTALQAQAGGVPSSSSIGSTTSGSINCSSSSSSSSGSTGAVTMAAAVAQGQPGECVTVLGTSADQVAQQASMITMQQAPVASSSAPSIPTSSSITAVGLVPHQAQHSPGRLLFTNQGSSMILSQESLQMFLQQPENRGSDFSPSVGVPASVIVNSASVASPAQLSDPLVGQSPPLVKQVPSSGHQQALKIQGMSPSPALSGHVAAPPVSDTPQPSQSPLTLSQQIQSPHQQQSRPPSQPQPPSQTPSRSCTPSSHPPSLFIVHNQIGESPSQPQVGQPQSAPIQVQLLSQPRPPSQPAPFQQQEQPPVSRSPKPPLAHPFAVAASTAPAVIKAHGPVHSLTADQQQHLALLGSQIQTLSAIGQPSLQQKQLLEKLHQIQQSILLQVKLPIQAQAPPLPNNQFSTQQDVPVDKAAITSSIGAVQPSPALPPAPALITSVAAASSDLHAVSGVQGPAGAAVNKSIASVSLTQPAQPKPGVINSVGGMTLGKGGMQIHVLGTNVTQMPAPQPPAPLQPQTTAKMPFSAEPSKEARFLEQLRKHQGSVLHPNYSASFYSFEDTLHRLLPYHLYQGTANSSQDYQKVDDEFESVSCQLLRRTQAMLDKYRYLLFSESKQRLGPSAEMVMIDRMFIQEEKLALSQDRILAKERPEEFVANARHLESLASSQHKSPPPQPGVASTGVAPAAAPPVEPEPAVPSHVAPKPPPVRTPSPTPVAPTPVAPPPSAAFPTKLVIKQGGGGASVSWSSSCAPPPPGGTEALNANPVFTRATETASSLFSSSSSSSNSKMDDDDDALPQRVSKPPIKTYEARRRIGLKLKIKQDQTGFGKVVHNTALDPVHASQPNKPEASPVSAAPVEAVRTQTTVAPAPAQSSSSSAQVNGTLEHRNPAPANPAPSQTTCRLPLRKTYRENVSPRVRPGVPGGGGDGDSAPYTAPALERTVIASVKVEKRGRDRDPADEAFNRAVKGSKGSGDDGSERDDFPKYKRAGGKTKQRPAGTFRMDQHAPGPPSPDVPSLAAKRCKSDSPDMDNASFSSGSPPDDSLNQHLQCAIDSILNLQQEPAPRGHQHKGGNGRTRPRPSAAPPPASSSSASSAASSLAQRAQVGGRGHNGSLAPRTQSR